MSVVQLKKTNYKTKSSEFEKKITDPSHDKYITTPEFNTFASDVLMQDQLK